MTARVERIGLATLYLGDCREIAPTLAEYRALVEQGPAAVMASKDDFLALLDKASAA